MLRILCITLMGLAMTAGPAASQDAVEPQQAAFRAALEAGDYDAAEKLAIRAFHPDWHCAVFIERGRQTLARAARVLDEAEAAGAVPEQAESLLLEARGHGDAAVSKAALYTAAGVDPNLTSRVAAMHERLLEELRGLEQRLDALRRRAKPLAQLVAQEQITPEDIRNLDAPAQFLAGLHLADRGEFDRAIQECFVQVRIHGADVLKSAAEESTDILQAWFTPATHNRKWDQLVNAGLTAYDQLKAAPDQAEAAGWLLALICHLARDHYDVPRGTIKALLYELGELRLPEPAGLDQQLLAAKLRLEQFLLNRRHERWLPPPAADHEVFQQTSSWWYLAEAALIGAAGQHAAPPDTVPVARQAAERLRQVNPALADAIELHINRFVASSQPFDRWLELAMVPDFRDARGTVLPDIMIETRSDLDRRVRAGFESRIAALVGAQRIDEAFQEVQRAKALTVGRVAAQTCSMQQLVSSELLTDGVGANRIATKELFIEYFLGPTQGWAFYTFAPGDSFEPMQVVRLDPADFERRCAETARALRAGGRVDDPSGWLLGGSPSLRELWDRREKTQAPQFRRIVLAPDRALCYVALDAEALGAASEVTIVPTAAVLVSADLFDGLDLELFWDVQRGPLDAAKPRVARRGRVRELNLGPGLNLSVLLQDAER